jgi:geranylgeranyl pyrophosphate synthase
LGSYGRTLGILTQLREEFSDIFEEEELNHRLRDEYLPLPILLAMQERKTKDRLDLFLRKGKRGIEDSSTVVEVIFQTASVKRLLKRMKGLVDRSILSLKQTRESKSKKMLKDLAVSMLEDL